MRKRLPNIFVFLLATTYIAALAQAPEAEWSYSGANGPENWANLSRTYHDCSWGHTQSPIDIWGATKTSLPAIQFEYRDAPLRIVNNGHTIQINYAPGSQIVVGGKKYQLLQFHFHRPSEEHVRGQAYDMTLHLVHADDRGKLAVVAVLMTHGPTNQTLQKIWAHLPNTKGQEQQFSSVTINAAALLPKAIGYYTFMGSLTTPPCSEGVTWFVLKTPTEISPEQISVFANIYPHNARPIEPTGLRTISESEF